MSAELPDAEPSEGLKRQCRSDEEVKWVVEKDLKTEILSDIANAIPLFVFTFVAGIVAFFIVTAELGAAVGFLAFLVVAFVPPFLRVAIPVYSLKTGGIEYAATTDRFVVYKDTLTETNVDAVPIERTRDAEYDEGFADKMFGTGNVRIEGARGDSICFEDSPHADAVLRAVRDDIEETAAVDVSNPDASVGD